MIAGSTVVYDWGMRSAELPTFVSAWLDRKATGSDEFDDSIGDSAS